MSEQLSFKPASVNEEWRPVLGYEGRYEVSNLGRVRSWLVAGRPLKKAPEKRASTPAVLNYGNVKKFGYVFVNLRKDSHYKSKSIAELVLEAFICPRPHGLFAAHWDGCGSNNRLDNLRWATRSENERDKRRHGKAPIGVNHHNAKLTEQSVRAIRCSYRNMEKVAALARHYSVSTAAIYDVIRRRTWPHVS